MISTPMVLSEENVGGEIEINIKSDDKPSSQSPTTGPIQTASLSILHLYASQLI